uniref:SPIN-DOC-like zinc-finger domain-containing protein n=1 Tax=Monopterus albus TaxID=43700 RepID=A0A3Q3IES4_MONAL
MTKKMAKRKKDEYRSFQHQWTEEFAFVERAGSAVCLICNDKISLMKRSNIKRHFDAHHATFASKYPVGDSRKNQNQNQLYWPVQTMQKKQYKQTVNNNSASFAGSLAIVRNGKPFTDGEYAKSFIHASVSKYCSQSYHHDGKSSGGNTSEGHKCSPFIPVQCDCKGERVNKRGGFIQEALCAQMCGEQLGEVMSLVIQVVNFIVARALNDRQFKTLLDEVGNNYPGLLLHSNVCWLSRGKVLSRFVACLSEIRTFLEIKDVKHPELANDEWLEVLLSCGHDLTSEPAQCESARHWKCILSLQQAVFAFENKLELFKMDIETGHLLHFEKLREFKDACTASDPFITHPHECAVDKADLSYIPGVSIRDFEVEVADLKASDMWVNKFKSLNEDLERLSFSYLKNLKTNLRSRLTDGSLNGCMKLNLIHVSTRLQSHQQNHAAAEVTLMVRTEFMQYCLFL